MDRSITLITPDLMRERGAEAFDRGLGVEDHEMNHDAAARKDWQFGWHARRIQRSRERGNQAAQQAPTEALGRAAA
jgi:hypothetical protein